MAEVQHTHHACVCALLLQLCLTLCNPMTVACKAPLSMGFSRQEWYLTVKGAGLVISEEERLASRLEMRLQALRALCGKSLKVKVKGTQLCLTLADPIDYTVHGILQARILEWVAFLFSRGSSQPRDRTQVSYMAGGFFIIWVIRDTQEYWSG